MYYVTLYVSHREKWSESSTPHAPRPKRPTSSIQLHQTDLHEQDTVYQDGGIYVYCMYHKDPATVNLICMHQ